MEIPTPQELMRQAVLMQETLKGTSELPVFMVIQAAREYNGNSEVSVALSRVIMKPSDILSALDFYITYNDRLGPKKLNKLSKQVQKGLAAAFNKFSYFDFQKCSDSHSRIKYRDALFLVHPKPNNKAQQEVFDKLAGKRI